MLRNKTLEHILNGLDAKEKDDIYRYLWAEHVREDVESQLSARNGEDEDDTDIDEEIIEYVVERYVYEGRYDCNLSYWDNIDNLIDEAESHICKDN